MDICLGNSPLLANLSATLATVPLLPDLLWLHEVFGPVLFDLSLTDTVLKFGREQYGTVQQLVQEQVEVVEAALTETGTLARVPWLQGTGGLVALGPRALVAVALALVEAMLGQVRDVVEEALGMPKGEVKSLVRQGLGWAVGVAEDEEVWITTMGINYHEKEETEEEGVACLMGYFYDFYVVEWYYDYIGYDYYHEDFDFYFYDDYDHYGSGSGSGSGSGDYDYSLLGDYDYSGFGGYDYSGHYDYYEDYSGSGSGSGSGFGYYDDDDYMYYEDHYADFHNVYYYFTRLAPALRSLLLAPDAEKVALALAQPMWAAVAALPAMALLDSADALVAGVRGSVEQGAVARMEGLAGLVGRVMEGGEEDLIEGVVWRLLGREVWEEATLEVQDLEQVFYAWVLEVARREGAVPMECEEDLGRGPVPLVCTTSTLLWRLLDWIEILELDNKVRWHHSYRSQFRTIPHKKSTSYNTTKDFLQVGISESKGFLKNRRKKAKKLTKWVMKQEEGVYCRLVGVAGEVGRRVVDVVVGEELQEGQVRGVMDDLALMVQDIMATC